MISFGSKAQQQTLDVLVAALDAILRPLVFERSDGYIWRRKTTFRVDEIDLVLKGGTFKQLLPSFRVILPRTKPSQFGDEFQHIAQINIARYLRPGAGPEFDSPIPSVSLTRDKFVHSIVSDINTALPWFEQFSTPESCRSSLVKFLKPGCPAYLDAEQFLNSLNTI